MRTETSKRGYWLHVCRVPVCLFALTKELDLQIPDLREVLYWIFLLKLLFRLKSDTLHENKRVLIFVFSAELFWGVLLLTKLFRVNFRSS
jgi:hypothetical protein